MRADHYDDFAEAYARENESNLFNAHYERPAMLDLAGDVSGRRVLDVGCGAGALAQALRDRGPWSPASTRARRWPRWPDGASATTSTSWSRTSPTRCRSPRGVRRRRRLAGAALPAGLVRPAGRAATGAGARRSAAALGQPPGHPSGGLPAGDYFATTAYTEDYTFDGRTAALTFWHRPLHAMTDAFSRAGFRISTVPEPPFSPRTPPSCCRPISATAARSSASSSSSWRHVTPVPAAHRGAGRRGRRGGAQTPYTAVIRMT